MQTCPDCGARNEDGELFCGACGTYLEWEEQQAAGQGSGTTAELTESGPAPEPVVEQVAEPVVEQVAEPVVEQVAEPAVEPATAEPPQAEPSPEPAVEPATAEPPGQVRSPGPLVGSSGVSSASGAIAAAAAPVSRGMRRMRRNRAAGTDAPAKASAAAEGSTAVESPPVAEQAAPVKPTAVKPVKPAAAVPAPVKPAAATPRRHVPPTAKDEPPPAPGDLICGACGAGNAPHRNFCRRCGASLADAPTQGRQGWWRRWRARRRARKEGPKAGTRPKRRRRRRFPTKTVVVLVLLGLIAGGGYYFRDEVSTGYNTVLDRVAGNDPVNPAEVTASSSATDRGPELARDGISDQSWAPEATGDGAGEWLQFEFAEPFRLVTVLLTAGASTEDETRLLEARPSRVRLTVTTADGQEQITDVDILDTGTPQPLALPVSDVVSLRMTILSSYGAADDHHVAVAEVEFRGR